MQALKRVLYAQAAAWGLAGVVLAVAPRFVTVSLFGGHGGADHAWIRLLGLNTVGLAMIMVLVAHRVDQVWWWSWAFALVTAASAAVTVLHTAFGLVPGERSVVWWAASLVDLAFAFALLYGLFVASREQPLPPELRAPPG
jgi:hypothetical protein